VIAVSFILIGFASLVVEFGLKGFVAGCLLLAAMALALPRN